MTKTIEERVRQRAARHQIQKIVLEGLYAGSALSMMVMAPNTLSLLKYVRKYIDDKAVLDARMYQACSRLVAKGLLIREARGRYRLSEKGRVAAENEAVLKRLHAVPMRWDGKWRLVIFDIWERRRAARDRLRSVLARNGFVRIQNSIWAYPYDCEELFAFLRANLSLGKGILYIVAEEIEGDAQLREHFGLRK